MEVLGLVDDAEVLVEVLLSLGALLDEDGVGLLVLGQVGDDGLGADEVIYLNENGELAEGSRTTIFLERDGKLLTPRLAAGVLPGTLRAALIDEGRAVEARLTIQDINGPGEIYLGNSVRGLVRAEPLVPRLAIDHRHET